MKKASFVFSIVFLCLSGSTWASILGKPTNVFYLDGHGTASAEWIHAQKNLEWQATDSMVQMLPFSGGKWLKITPNHDGTWKHTSDSWIFSLGTAIADHVKVSVFVDGQMKKELLWGDLLPFAERTSHLVVPAFHFNYKKGENLELLVFVESPIIHAFSINLDEEEDFYVDIDPYNFLSSGYLFVMLAMIAYHLCVYYITKIKGYFHYSIAFLGFMIMTITLNGFGAHYIWRDMPWFQERALAIGPAIGFIGFSRFLQSFFPNFIKDNLTSRFIKFSYWYGYFALIASIVLPSDIAVALVWLSLPPALAFHIWALTSFIQRGSGLLFINISLLFNAAGGIVNGLTMMNIITPNFFTINSFVFTNLVDLFLFSGALAYHIKRVDAEKEAIVRSLSGVVSDNLLGDIVVNVDKIPKDVVHAEVTVMFVDIVGFSKLFDVASSESIFNSLKSNLGMITEVILRRGGTIDRSLGDGVLAFFGYNLLGESTKNHAELALETAIELQMLNFDRILGEDSIDVYPLRIGIHSARNALGNVGMNGRLDFTIIGDGVNLASRYESACSPHRIVFSEEVYDGLSDASKSALKLEPIKVKIKHRRALKTAYECNPFANRGDELSRADHLYWQSRKISKGDPRYGVEAGGFSLECSDGVFELVNFSRYGMALISDTYFGRGVQLGLVVKFTNIELMDYLKSARIDQFTVEVCWSRNSNGGYKHGVKLIGLHSDLLDDLFSGFMQYLNTGYLDAPSVSA